MKRLRIQTMLAATLLGGAMSLFTACAEEDNTGSPTSDQEKADQLQVMVTADVPTAVLSQFDETMDSENTIKNLVNTSKDMLSDPNALQTLKGYALDLGISQFTIKWYCTEGKHNAYDMTVSAK